MMVIPNWINGKEVSAKRGETFTKINPATGEKLHDAVRSTKEDIDEAVHAAEKAFVSWSTLPGVERGVILRSVCQKLEANHDRLSEIAALETGKSKKDALGETNGAIATGYFFAAEGQRLYGFTTTSSVPGRQVSVVREPLGVVGLIVPANTPVPNILWKVFPALICGNTIVLKSSEYAPATAALLGKLFSEAGLPSGVLNIVHGLGAEAGAALADHPAVPLLSFTGSCKTGEAIAHAAAKRSARVSLELGGKNAFVVCDDADLKKAAMWAAKSAFSNAGQRCSAGSRIIVFDTVYEKFCSVLLDEIKNLKIGTSDGDDLGPVITEEQMNRILAAIDAAKKRGGKVLCGGNRSSQGSLARGFYVEPTLFEGLPGDDPLSQEEIFGPVSCLYRVKDFSEALALANNTNFGLTAAIHTNNLHRAHLFARGVRTGVVHINAGTLGIEPHLPFGGMKKSGNGTREPGVAALDVYSSMKTICINTDTAEV